MTTVRSFNAEVKALEEYGHDCCARIDDKIHECCKRISEAHEDEVAAVDLALRLKELQDFGYDVLGNERHKTALALKNCEFTYTKVEDNLEVLLVDGFGIRGSACYQEAFERLRDRLIYLLVGDQNPVKFSELFGILKEDSDGVDAGRCDEADSDCPDAPAAERTGDCVHHQDVQGLAPITTELRDMAERYCNFKNDNIVKFKEEDFDCLCDAIDAIHAQLERENEELRTAIEDAGLERALSNMHAAGAAREEVLMGVSFMEGELRERINMLEREVKRLTAECKTQRNNFDQATSAREHWKSLYEQSLEQIHDLEHDVEMWRDRAEDMRMERDDALKKHPAWAPESHYMLLPKDKDGLPIHVGDVMEFARFEIEHPVQCEVFGVGQGVFFAWCKESGYTQKDAVAYRHAKSDTWEQIIEDALDGYHDTDFDALVARCKTLAGDADE